MAIPEQLEQWHPLPLPLLHPLQLWQHRHPCTVMHRWSSMTCIVGQGSKLCGQVLVWRCKPVVTSASSEHLHLMERGDPI